MTGLIPVSNETFQQYVELMNNFTIYLLFDVS